LRGLFYNFVFIILNKLFLSYARDTSKAELAIKGFINKQSLVEQTFLKQIFVAINKSNLEEMEFNTYVG